MIPSPLGAHMRRPVVACVQYSVCWEGNDERDKIVFMFKRRDECEEDVRLSKSNKDDVYKILRPKFSSAKNWVDEKVEGLNVGADKILRKLIQLARKFIWLTRAPPAHAHTQHTGTGTVETIFHDGRTKLFEVLFDDATRMSFSEKDLKDNKFMSIEGAHLPNNLKRRMEYFFECWVSVISALRCASISPITHPLSPHVTRVSTMTMLEIDALSRFSSVTSPFWCMPCSA